MKGRDNIRKVLEVILDEKGTPAVIFKIKRKLNDSQIIGTIKESYRATYKKHNGLKKSAVFAVRKYIIKHEKELNLRPNESIGFIEKSRRSYYRKGRITSWGRIERIEYLSSHITLYRIKDPYNIC